MLTKTGLTIPMAALAQLVEVSDSVGTVNNSLLWLKWNQLLLRDALFSHISQNNLFSDGQHGYMLWMIGPRGQQQA